MIKRMVIDIIATILAVGVMICVIGTIPEHPHPSTQVNVDR